METKTFVTQSGIEVEIKAFITGREAENLATAQSNAEGDKNIATSHEALRIIVVRVGTEIDTSKTVDAVLDMILSDYQQVMNEVLEIVTGKKDVPSTQTIS